MVILPILYDNLRGSVAYYIPTWINPVVLCSISLLIVEAVECDINNHLGEVLLFVGGFDSAIVAVDEEQFDQSVVVRLQRFL